MRDPIPYVLPYEYLKPMLSLSVKKRGLEIEESDGVETPLEPVQKKAKFKGEASKSAAISKWSGEEHDILTRMVDDQLELEKADDSQVISWTALWKKISSALHETGYERSWQACRVRWERFQEAEVKTTGLASDEVEPQVLPVMIDGQLGAKDVEISDSTPERRAPQVWSNEENNILALLTHCQLGLLPKNDSTLYQWHWERISSIMKQCGFDRNPRGCQMAWNRYVKPGANYGGPRNFYFDPTTLTGQSVQNGFDDLGKFLIRNFQYIDNDLNRLWLAGKAVELLEERGAPSARRE